MQGEDVQNEGRTVDDLHGLVHDLLQIGLLGRCQLIVEDDEVGLVRPCQLGDFFVGLARADEGARVGRVQALGRRGHHIGSGRESPRRSSSAREDSKGHGSPGRSTPTRTARSRRSSALVAGPFWMTEYVFGRGVLLSLQVTTDPIEGKAVQVVVTGA